MALAFFIARISFAAASAAGEACLSGGADAGACWATAGTPATASPNARLAADKILEKRFIPILLRFSALPPFNYANSLRACQDCHAGKASEQPVLDNTRYQGQ